VTPKDPGKKLMKTIIAASLVAASALVATGCGLRSAEYYRDDVQKVLESKSADVKNCYDKALEGDKKLAGPVTVRFTVAEDTGKIQNPVVQGDANPALQECVVRNIEGLELQPPDVNPGDGTFTWEFSVGDPKKGAS
jgi:hypothetical protein